VLLAGPGKVSHFGDSGIVEHDPAFDEIVMQGGREVKMPSWKDLTAARQLLSDAASLTVNKINSDQDIARIHNDAQVWSVNHLAKVVSGDDPLQAIVDLVGGKKSGINRLSRRTGCKFDDVTPGFWTLDVIRHVKVHGGRPQYLAARLICARLNFFPVTFRSVASLWMSS
jgi:hypothetical protein